MNIINISVFLVIFLCYIAWSLVALVELIEHVKLIMEYRNVKEEKICNIQNRKKSYFSFSSLLIITSITFVWSSKNIYALPLLLWSFSFLFKDFISRYWVEKDGIYKTYSVIDGIPYWNQDLDITLEYTMLYIKYENKSKYKESIDNRTAKTITINKDLRPSIKIKQKIYLIERDKILNSINGIKIKEEMKQLTIASSL